MKKGKIEYSNVYISAIGYELAPVVVTSEELEERLIPVYSKLHIPRGQLVSWTGIEERRWWPQSYSVVDGAVLAARNALQRSSFDPRDIEVLIYGSVCREGFEPATACHVAAEIGVDQDAIVFDISNACLGVLNAIIEIGNRIALKQISAGMVVACESAREINETVIKRLLAEPDRERMRYALATLTGGSGAIAVILTDSPPASGPLRRVLGGVSKAELQHHMLCRWGLEPSTDGTTLMQYMTTDSVAVLNYGVNLAQRTWAAFLEHMGWTNESVDSVICHQVGASHRDTILSSIGISEEKDFPTFSYLGNIGSVSLPLTAVLAEERGKIQPGNHVGFLGIGSGLNCIMLGVDW